MSRNVSLISVVVPTYNERDNVPRLLAGLESHVRTPYEVIVVDDASPDGTAELARDLAGRHPVRVIEREGKKGLGSAYRDGFNAARGDAIFEMDADLSHDPRFVEDLVDAVRGGAGLAIGSRYVPGGGVKGWGPHRHVVSRGANALARFALRIPVHDATSGFRCFAREHVDLVTASGSDGYEFQIEVLNRAIVQGVRVVEVPIMFEDRRHGESKLGAADVARFARSVARLRREAATAPT